MTITMYGIPNCDTIKKARNWLGENGIAFAFHDYKKAGVPEDALQVWIDELGWEVLLNKAGTTFKKLPDDDKQDLNADKAFALMVANPSMIKRPVLDLGKSRLVGFKPALYEAAFTKI